MRTTAEIVKRMNSDIADDFLSTCKSELLSYLPVEDAQAFRQDDADPKDWEQYPSDNESILAEMKKYMIFAIDKATDHRGISANRSIAHFAAWLWMLGDDDYQILKPEDYRQYGMPILKAIATRYGFDFPSDSRATNMADGLPCSDFCEEGCG